MTFPVLGSLIDPAQINGIAGPMQLPGMPQPNLPPPSMLQRLRGRLGQMGTAPFEVPEAMGLDPKQAAQAQNSARIQLALGLLGNVGTGRGFGHGLTSALQNAQQGFQGQLGNLHAIARQTKMDERQAKRDELGDQRWQLDYDRGIARDMADQDYKAKVLAGNDADRATTAADREAARGLTREQMAQQATLAEAQRKAQLDIANITANARTNQLHKPTEYDKKASLLYGEMHDAEKQLQGVGVPSKTSMVWNSALGSTPVTRVFTSEDYRKYEAAGTRWAQNFLYLKSGAQAPEQEVERTMKQYLPQPGDPAEVVAQKAVARQQAMQNVAGILNPAAGGAAAGPQNLAGWSIEPVQ